MKKHIGLSIVLLIFSFAASQAVAQDIHDAVERGEIDRVELFLKTQTKLVDNRDQNGDYPLHRAAQHGHLAIVEMFVQSDADVNAENNEAENTLALCCLLRPTGVGQAVDRGKLIKIICSEPRH